MLPRDYSAIVAEYVESVVSGRHVAGRFVRMACERHLDDLANAGERGFYFDEDKAIQAALFIETFCRNPRGRWAGQKMKLEPWQLFVVFMIFGWRELATITREGREFNLRRFRTAYLTIARKGGKSTFAAAVALTMLFFDDPIEAGAQVYSAATTRDQASIVHKTAVEMVRREQWLNSRSRIFKHGDLFKAIVLADGEPYHGSVFKPLASETGDLDGLEPHLVIEDELHAWRRIHRENKEKLETGGGSRDHPLIFITTTAGDERSEIWLETDNYATAVLDGFNAGRVVDDRYFAFIARLDEKRPCGDCGGDSESCEACGGTGEIPADDPFDDTNWIKANPSLGVTPSVDYIRQQATRAQNDRSFLNTFMRYHGNSKVSSTDKPLPSTIWIKTRRPLTDWSEAEQIAGAFDIGQRDDLASIGLAARFATDDGPPRYEVRQLSFCPEDGPRKLSQEPFASFVADKVLIPTYGETTDLETMRIHIGDLAELYGCGVWAFDPHNALQMAQLLESEFGVETFRFNQNWSMYNEPLRQFLKLCRDGRISSGDDDLLGWTAGNLATKEGARGDLMPDKRKAAEKIDPICAVFMAFGVLILQEVETQGSYYEENELEWN